MIKLYVDDIRPAPDHTWMLATSISSAVNAIARFGPQIEEISLDHDISHQITTTTRSAPFPCEETFTPVAYVIAYFYRNLPKCPKVTIHTSNTAGANRMKDILRDELKDCVIVVSPMKPANRFENAV